MTAITDKKLRDKVMEEKTLELNQTIELIEKNTSEKKNKKNTKPEALISTKEKHAIKVEPLQKWRNSEHDQKLDRREIDLADIAEYRIGHHYTNAEQ